MSEIACIFLYLFGIVQGLAFGYAMWGPKSNFKDGFINGLTLQFLWKKKNPEETK